MGFIGYSESGYTELAREITNSKEKLLNILGKANQIQTAISNCWKGEDADVYKEELRKVIEATKNSVTETYDALANQCRTTYEEWISKQSGK